MDEDREHVKRLALATVPVKDRYPGWERAFIHWYRIRNAPGFGRPQWRTGDQGKSAHEKPVEWRTWTRRQRLLYVYRRGKQKGSCG